MERIIKIALAFTFIIIFNIPIYSSEPIIITNSIDSYPLGSNLLYYEDTSNTFKINKIITPEIQKEFKKSTIKIPNFGFKKSTFWFTFSILNKQNQPLVIKINWPLFDYIEIYEKTADKVKKLFVTGDSYQFDHRPYKNRIFIFPIKTHDSTVHNYYISIRSQDSIQVPLTIVKMNKFHDDDRIYTFIYGMYIGSIIIIILYTIMVFLSIRDRSYLFYFFLLISFIFFELSYQGIGFSLIWKDYPFFQNISLPLSMSTWYIAVVLFTKVFLDSKKTIPKINILFNIHIAGSILGLILSFTIPVIYSLIILNIWAIIGANIIFLSLYLSLKNGFRAARFYTIAWFSYLIGGSMLVLKNFGLLPINHLTSYSFQYGAVIQIVLFSLALSDKININKKEKEIAQKNLIENQKVALDIQTEMTNAFARFVPKEFLTFLNKKSIVEVELGNQIQKEMTVLFSDIRSFTSLSEKMTPQENFNFLNSYLKRIGPIIRSNGGFIDKYIGDAVMALFPDSPSNAIDTALLMQNTVLEYNSHRKGIGYDEITIGIGIHSGNLMLGTIGEENRMEGTVISDDVNLASRIESLTKYYGAEILISGKLFNQLSDKTKYQYRIIDTVIVKGRSEPVTLIEILDQKTTKNYDLKIETKPKLVEAIKLYREKSITDALNIFKELSTQAERKDRVYEIYITRCNKLLTEGIPDNFIGVEKLENK